MKYINKAKHDENDYNKYGSYEENAVFDNIDDNVISNKDNSKRKSMFHNHNEGIGVVEIILILVILIAIVLIFREKITSIVNSALQSIETDSGTIIGTDK